MNVYDFVDRVLQVFASSGLTAQLMLDFHSLHQGICTCMPYGLSQGINYAQLCRCMHLEKLFRSIKHSLSDCHGIRTEGRFGRIHIHLMYFLRRCQDTILDALRLDSVESRCGLNLMIKYIAESQIGGDQYTGIGSDWHRHCSRTAIVGTSEVEWEATTFDFSPPLMLSTGCSSSGSGSQCLPVRKIEMTRQLIPSKFQAFLHSIRGYVFANVAQIRQPKTLQIG